MKRGRLRVFLGAAPGVGKTHTMLEEGLRLRDEGEDVVVALVETHGRKAIAALASHLEEVPRRTVHHRGIGLEEMDLDAVLARAPRIALVDEFAHTNAPGTRHHKRWEDVTDLLNAGVHVMTTVNIQHIESLNDVVHQITGVPQRETIPDRVLRAADQIELVDLASQSLRDRLALGAVYPAERINAALSNYFRLGNLTALRELALLWLADEVDNALKDYRAEHHIDSKWEARERVVVALTGGPEGETLLRRGARIAARSGGGELLAVHVNVQEGLREAHPEVLAAQRALTEQLGGTFHQVLGDDVPRSLVEFARAVDATQLVIGISRRGRLTAALTGPGIGATVIRESGGIDVHIVDHAAAGGRFTLPRLGGALSLRRRLAGFALSLVTGPLLTWFLVSQRGAETLISDVLSYQLLVVVVSLVGGIWPALYTAIMSGVTLDLLFVEPLLQVTVDHPIHLIVLLLYVANALLVSYLVDRSARRARAAKRAGAEADLLVTIAGGVLRGQDALEALMERTREAFSLDAVRLRTDERTLWASGEPDTDTRPLTLDVGGRAVLELYGAEPGASERRLLKVITTQIDAALEHQDLAATADEVKPLAENDQVRSALLSAVSHDLRRPLTAATTAVGSLRSVEVEWSPEDREELLATAEESLETLTALVTDLLDVSRLQAGVLAVAAAETDVDEVILPALDELGLGPGEVDLELDPELPTVLADAGLLQRVIVNLLANAVRFSPEGRRARVATSAFGSCSEIRVIDHGPGVSPERLDQLFVPFQRLGDVNNTMGLGLGLTLSKGFTEGMGGRLTAEDTPGGGLTMVISLPIAHPGTGEARP